jgi:hypothetical protein
MDHQGAAGILPKPSDERKRDEAFPTIKISEPNEATPLSHCLLFAHAASNELYPEATTLARQLRKQRRSLHQISDELFARGHRYPKGRPIEISTISKMVDGVLKVSQ